MRKVCYISGTRADFGLMSNALTLIHQHPELALSICVVGQHLLPAYGNTVSDIEKTGFTICGRIQVDLDGTSGDKMANAFGEEVIGITTALKTEKPDIVLLLGDRGEMLAGAIAAIHLNIPVIHIHGGERSGTIDEMFRHAISKLSHYHFVATQNSKERLIKMGELSDSIFVTGAPGLDNITVTQSREELCREINLKSDYPIGLMIYHPVVQEAEMMAYQVRQAIDAALKASLQLIWVAPNSDTGGFAIKEVMSDYSNHPNVKMRVHLERSKYFSWMAAVDLILGNSSSAIIEAPSFGLVAVNIGTRQNSRERSENVIDVAPESEEITKAIQKALLIGKRSWHNVYGDGNAGQRMVELLMSLPLNHILNKSNAF